MPPRIFIGGTGRSGTTILYQALGCQEAIHAFPKEMRFLVDQDGLMTLLDALTTQYSPTRAAEALYRFERLMRVYLTVPQRDPYKNFEFDKWLGGEYYWKRLDQFCSTLVEQDFPGTNWQVEPVYEGRLSMWTKQLTSLRQRLEGKPVVPFRLTLPRLCLKIVKYFPNREELITSAASFVDDLFLHAAHLNGKQTWCEKTPQNLFHLDFLWELFPECVYIHVKRDPRGVAHSLTKQRWAPNDLRGACLYLRDAYKRWFDIKNTIDLNKYRYLELKLEDLAASPQTTFAEITEFCGVQNCFEGLPDISLDKVNYWQNVMTDQEVALVNQILAPYIEQIGYEV